MKKKKLSILFIGNSHTYFNDMPLMVQRRAIDEGLDCHVAMIAHGGWSLTQHTNWAEYSEIDDSNTGTFWCLVNQIKG